MQLSSDLAALIGFACEAVLWGVNCTLFIVSLLILNQRRLRQNLHNPVIYLNCLIFLCCTTHFALEFNHFYTTLNATGVTNYSAETTQLLAADSLISFTDLFGDFALAYRCYMLWDKNYFVVILPLLAAVGGFACIVSVISLLLATDPTSPAPPPALVPLGLAGYILPLSTNIMITSLIVYRIWSSSRSIPGSTLKISQSATRRAMILVIESGALYLLFQLVFVVLFAAQNPAEGILAVMAVQIYGIAPTLIIIRVGLGMSSEQSATSVMSTRIKWLARRGEDSHISGTGYSDGLVTSTDFEGIKDSDSSTPENHTQDTELVQLPHTLRAEGIPI